MANICSSSMAAEMGVAELQSSCFSFDDETLEKKRLTVWFACEAVASAPSGASEETIIETAWYATDDDEIVQTFVPTEVIHVIDGEYGAVVTDHEWSERQEGLTTLAGMIKQLSELRGER